MAINISATKTNVSSLGSIPEESYLQLSGIQHFAFCRRQWALIHIEQQWADNLRTVEGTLLHARAHDPLFTEKRKDVLITRDLPVFSRSMGVSGKCDVVEFHKDDENGIALFGRKGLWRPCPIEYKRGRPKVADVDRLQLCAQAICLEEMLLCKEIETAYLYYAETRRRETVVLSPELRQSVRSMFTDMHDYLIRKHTPHAKQAKSCNACSLKDICIPGLPRAELSVDKYLNKHLAEATETRSAP